MTNASSSHRPAQRQGVEAVDGLIASGPLRPYRDLALLRHDFPLVLVARPAAPRPALSPGSSSGAARAGAAGHGRRAAAQARPRARARDPRACRGPGSGLLSELWKAAAERSRPGDNADEVLRYTASALKLDGDIVGCDAAMPARFVAHLGRTRTPPRRAHSARSATPCACASPTSCARPSSIPPPA